MKKLLVMALLSLAAVSSWAQGTVQFQNGQIVFNTTTNQDGSLIDRLVYLGGTETAPGVITGGTKILGTNYAAGLFYVSGANNSSGLGRSDDNRTQMGTQGSLAGALAFFRNSPAAAAGIWNNGTA